MGSVTGYEPSHPLKQRNTAEYGTREPYYRSVAVRPWFLALVCSVFCACAREKKRPERTEPWPAPSVSASSSSAARAVGLRSYEVEKSSLGFELPTSRLVTLRGHLPAASGRFEIDFENPERSNGSVRVDLGLLEID